MPLAIAAVIGLALLIPILLICACRSYKKRQEEKWFQICEVAAGISDRIGPSLKAPYLKYVVIDVGDRSFLATHPCAPDSHEVRHEDIVLLFESKGKVRRKTTVIGGGRLIVINNAVTSYGSSGDYGSVWEYQLRPLLEKIVQKEMPGATIIIK